MARRAFLFDNGADTGVLTAHTLPIPPAVDILVSIWVAKKLSNNWLAVMLAIFLAMVAARRRRQSELQ